MPLDTKVKEALEFAHSLNLPPLHTLSVDVARKMAAEQLAPPSAEPRSVGQVVNRAIDGPGGLLPIRIYTPPGHGPFPMLMFFHGGGFVLGTLDTHDAICRDLCLGADCVVISVDYRLAPEHKFPAATDDCLAATRWAAAHATELNGDATRMAVSGDSAGGNLAAVTTLRIRDEGGPTLRGQVLAYPLVAHYNPPTQSYLDNADGYFLTRAACVWFVDHYLRDTADAVDPLAMPLLASDLSRLPPAQVITAEFDPLRDEGKAYAERLRVAGVAAQYINYAGMIHGFYGAPLYPQGGQALAESCVWLRQVMA